jgi:hypothetical protein
MLGVSFKARRIDVRARKAAAGALHVYLLVFIDRIAATRSPARRSASFRVTEIVWKHSECRRDHRSTSVIAR